MPNARDFGIGVQVPSKPKESTKSAADVGRWQKFQKWFSFVKGFTIFGFAGTLIAAYFQFSLSSYEERLSTQAKDAIAAATETFVDATNTISTAITLQKLLYYDFARASNLNVLDDQKSLTTEHANFLYKPYEDAYVALQEKVQVLARKAEIYLDRPSDLFHNPQLEIFDEPMSTYMLGVFNFDCDSNMPSFEKHLTALGREADGPKLTIDWYSTKHHILTIGYCFDLTHKAWMEVVRQWASGSTRDSNATKKFIEPNSLRPIELRERLERDEKRFNDFMTVAMREIELIRARYQPSGISCYFLATTRCASTK